jgi:hypothetical protein
VVSCATLLPLPLEKKRKSEKISKNDEKMDLLFPGKIFAAQTHKHTFTVHFLNMNTDRWRGNYYRCVQTTATVDFDYIMHYFMFHLSVSYWWRTSLVVLRCIFNKSLFEHSIVLDCFLSVSSSCWLLLLFFFLGRFRRKRCTLTGGTPDFHHQRRWHGQRRLRPLSAS